MTTMAMVLLGVVAGCDDATAGGAPAGTISGTIRYQGPAAGPGRPLAIAVYTTFPPSGPPVAAELVDTDVFPYAYELTGLRPGVYWVGALIDVDRLDTRYAGMLNADRDPYGYAGGGAPVLVGDVEGAAGVDIELAHEAVK